VDTSVSDQSYLIDNTLMCRLFCDCAQLLLDLQHYPREP
jgi:hypothetical protein